MSRVQEYPQSIGARWFTPSGQSHIFEQNMHWINQQMDEGARILDIGPSPSYPNFPRVSSEFCRGELVQIAERGCELYERLF